MSCPEPISSALGSPASPSAPLASASPKTIRGGSGRTLPDSFATYDQRGCCWRTFQGSLLEGWETFSGTWPHAGMTRSGIAFRRPPSAPLTAETASGLLPTPEASNTKAVALRTNGRPPRNFLLREIVMDPSPRDLWPTPTARLGDEQRGLPSPELAERRYRQGRRNLDDAIAMWPTPTAHPRTHSPRQVDHGRQLANEVGGQLNPTWVEWLMGFPLGWTDLAVSATPSSPRSPSTSDG